MSRMRWLAIAVPVWLLYACGGGGGGNNPLPEAEPLRVLVSAAGEGSTVERAEVLLLRATPEVPVARVRAKAGRANGAKALLGGVEVVEIAGQRDAQGRYLFGATEGREGYLVSARAVRDTRLGVNPLIELLAPLVLFDEDDALVVNPVTTLVALSAATQTGAQAGQTLAQVLAALGGEDVQDPRANIPVLFALALGEFVPGWPQQIAEAPGRLPELLAALDAESVPASLRTEFELRRSVAQAILTALQDPAVTDITAVVNAIEFAARARSVLESAGVAADPDVVRGLADAAIAANGGRSLGENQVAGNVVRYLVNQYALSDLTVAPAGTVLTAVAGDPAIAGLAAAGGVILTSVPLLEGEFLGLDEQRRRDYYYQSERSPLSYVPVLYAGITDANITDHGQVALVIANARAGRMDEAAFIARTQIFGTVAEAEGLIQLGYGYHRAGRTDEAKVAYEEALDFYLDYLDALGLANFTSNDAGFLQRLIGRVGELGFLGLGDDEGAARAAAPMEAFVEAYGQGLYQTVIGRYITAQGNIASSAVDDAVAAGATADAKSIAEYEVDRFRELLRSVKIPQAYAGTHSCAQYSSTGDEVHYAVRAISMVGVVSHYQRLGLHDKALAVVEEDLPLVRGTDYASCRTEIYLDDVAADLVRMGMDEQAEALLAGFTAKGIEGNSVAPDYVAAARVGMAAAMADVLRDAGDIEGAVEVVLESISGNFRVRDVLRQLTYLNVYNRSLAGTLVDRGQMAQAKIAIDAAREFFNGDEYAAWIASRPTSPWTTLIPEAGKIAQLYAQAGYGQDAEAFAAQLEAQVRDNYWQTSASRVDAIRLLVTDVYQPMGALDHALALLETARGEAHALDAGASASALNTIARMMVRLDVANLGVAGEVLEEAYAKAQSLCCEVLADTELAAARAAQFEQLRAIALSHAEAVGRSRAAVWQAARAGLDTVELRAPIAAHRERARDIQLQAADRAASIGNAGTRTLSLHFIALDLAKLDWRDEALATAERIESVLERHYARRSVALALLRIDDTFTGSYNSLFSHTVNVWFAGYNDYPVYTATGHDPRALSSLISVDTDGDGLPDFYSPLATQAQIDAIGLPLDEDMDGDGVPDSSDRYPLDPSRY